MTRWPWFFLSLALVGAPGRFTAAAGPTDIPGVDEFIDAPRALFGRTRQEIEARLGTPLQVEARGARSTRDPRVTDTLHELSYPGILIRVHASTALERVQISEPRYRLPRGLNIGTSRSQVEEALGEPQASTDTRSLYLYSDGYPDTVEFHFRDNRVQRIEWTYWVDR